MSEPRSINSEIREKRYEDGFRVMQGKREYVTYPDDSSLRIWYSDVPWRYENHEHSAVEICLTLEGVVDYMVQDTIYHVRKGEILILSPDIPHSLNMGEGSSRYLFLFEPDMIYAMRDVKVALRVPRLQGTKVGHPIILENHDGRMVVQQQQIVHEFPTATSVSIGEGMDVLKDRMEVCRNGKRLALRRLQHLGEQRDHFCMHLYRSCPDISRANHVVPHLVCTRALPCRPSSLVVGALCQRAMNFQNKRLVDRMTARKGIQYDLMAFLEVLNLEERARVTRETNHTSVLKDIPGVVISYRGILDGPRVISKANAIVCKGSSKLVATPDALSSPFRNDILIDSINDVSFVAHAAPHR